MGLTVSIVSEAGEKLSIVKDPTNILHAIFPDSDDGRSRCIGFVDWYGLTIFNHIQVKALLSEIDALRGSIGKQEREKVAEVLALGARVLELAGKGEHVLLRFDGD
jgi:hypothetical protein